MTEEKDNISADNEEVAKIVVDVDSRLVDEDKQAKISKNDKTSKIKAKKIMEELNQRVIELEKENEELKNQNLKKRAEFENFRKRMEKDKDDFVKYSLEKFIKELLPILDSFNVALNPSSILEEHKQIYEGFSLIYKQFQDLLSKSGVVEIEAVGKVFDPNFHQAVSQEQSEQVESGVVIREYQKGYRIHDRILRPSMVVVAQ